ncbi:MAG: hypothetical protein MUE36_02335 [Acidimicrobiales bacterium]|jgi:hypothetical protein|nr:hypothetical protein [Acidimicrobiales bacterium]
MALDVNFPEPILASLAEFLVDVELIPVRRIDPALSELDDRALMLALRQEGFDWLITNNYRMLRNPSELAAILKARMKIFAIQGLGSDPLRATGALLLDLPGAVRRSRSGRSEVFWSRPRNPEPQDPWELLERAADHRHQEAAALYEEVAVSDEEAAQPWRGRD